MTRSASAAIPTVHPMQHVVVFAFLAIIVSLGIRTLAFQDARLGWGMFSYQMNYQMSYAWALSDGTTRPESGLDLEAKLLLGWEPGS